MELSGGSLLQLKTMFVPVLVVLLLSGPQCSLQGETQEMESSEDILEKDYIYPQRNKRTVGQSVTPTDKCSYTFIVPQQKNNGAICVNSKEPEAQLESRVHKQELELLNLELQKQRKQIEALQQLVEVDGGIVNEVKLLRKESRNMNSRVTQLYMQLLHEIIRKRDNALEVSQLETRMLNQTNEMGQLAMRYRELEHKYQHLSTIASNQSILLVQLEERCKRGGYSPSVSVDRDRSPLYPQPPVVHHSPPQNPALSPGGYRPFHPHTLPRHNTKTMTNVMTNSMTNEIQNDQNPKALSPLPPPTLPSATHSFTNEPSGPFKDCLQALDNGYTVSGMYLLKPENANKLMQAWCDMRHDPGGWTIILRRQDGSVNFFRNWETYKQGFGNINGEYWLGLENIYSLTNQGNYKLLVTLEDWSGRKTFAEYASFRIEPESQSYRLRIGRYHGNAGDSLTWHNGKQFTTLDRDHDAYTGNCAHYQKGGWWYNACAHSNLSGVWYRGGHYRSRYQDGVYWAEFRGGAYSLKKVTMMIRPNANTYH
ncbi:angiopoietin-related protein 2 [Periophthalmus magnuspinnatus]|uniref:angiopoietin-related protein 2 n=1 Tax=Periophthalmus magnuspinnatus TaxID=409849 RepID=UPI0024372B3F|nr:angiopoietin-related protein 2 [Periophthalmus magnuspinnatus]